MSVEITYNGTTTQAIEVKGKLVKKGNGNWVLDDVLKAGLKGQSSPVSVVLLTPIKP